MNKIKFKEYVAKRGLKPVKVWQDKTGFYAQIKGSTRNTDGFSQILQGGTVVRLSLKDLTNSGIVGDGVEVILKGKTK